MTDALALDFIGHSAMVIDLDGVRLLTDPATRARIGHLRRIEPVPARTRLHGIDAVLISHLHWDHLDVPSLRDLGKHVLLIVPRGSGPWMLANGFTNVRELGVGESVDVGPLTVRAVPAVHSGYRPPLGPTAPAIGFVVRGTRTIYFAGDTDLFSGMGELGEPIDVALIPVWGWGPTLGRGLHLDPVKAAESLRLIKPRLAVPIHWGTYWPYALGRVYPERLIEPPAAFAEHAADLAPNVRIALTEVGTHVDLGPLA